MPIYYICPGCKARYGIGFANSYPSTIAHCPGCGEKLITKCPKCKTEIAKDNENYCPYCGTEDLE